MTRYECPRCEVELTGNPLRFVCPDCGERLVPTTSREASEN